MQHLRLLDIHMNFEAMAATVNKVTTYGVNRDQELSLRSARLSNELSESLLRSRFFDCDISPNQEAECKVVNGVHFYTFQSVVYKSKQYASAIFALKEDEMGYPRVVGIVLLN